MKNQVKKIEFTEIDEIADEQLNGASSEATNEANSAKEKSASAFHLDLVKNLETALTAVIGSTTLTVEQLYGLKVGEVVKLSETIDQPVELFLGEVKVAEGHLVAIDEYYGVELSQVTEIAQASDIRDE